MARLVLDIEHFRLRVLQDALDQATIDYWLRRANDIAQAAPRPGDFIGRNTTPVERAARAERTRITLLNIERHVGLLQEAYSSRPISSEVNAAITEAA